MARILHSTPSMHRLLSTSATKVINIPKRIERGPTDVLKALASVVGRDHTATSYTFMDDPQFEPFSYPYKRTLAISREQGRRAAKYFLHNYPHLFYRNDAEPKIPAFDPPDLVTADVPCVEENIIASIEASQVSNAIQCYKNCIENKVPVSPETEQMLLELCCFSDCKDIEYEWLQEKWYLGVGEQSRTSWQEDSFAETLYAKIGENEASINCMICGGVKFGAFQRVKLLHERAKELGLSLSLETYNALLSAVNFFASSGEARKEATEILLSEMRKNGIKPDSETFVTILSNLCKTLAWRECQSYALRVFNEMVELKISPSLASYYHLIYIFTESRSSPSAPEIIYSIMGLLKSQVESLQNDPQSDGKLHLQHLRGGFFFTKAMAVINQMLSDLQLADDLHRIAMSNPHCFGSANLQDQYYREYFSLLCKVGTIDQLLEQYEKLVPHSYLPDTEMYGAIMESLALEGREDLIPRFLSDSKFYHPPKDQRNLPKSSQGKTNETNKNEL